jgi:hypothetical protein
VLALLLGVGFGFGFCNEQQQITKLRQFHKAQLCVFLLAWICFLQ